MVVVTVISLLYSLFPSSFSALILMVYAVSGDRFLTTTEFDDPGLDDMNMVFPSIQFSCAARWTTSYPVMGELPLNAVDQEIDT